MEFRGVSPFRSIKGKLLLFALCVSLIPIAVITSAYYLNARSTLKRETIDWLTAVAESRKAHVLEFLEAKKGRAIDFSSDGFIRDSLEKINRGEFPRQDNVSALNRHLSINKMPLDYHIIAVAVVNMNGEVVASTNETLIGRDVSDRSYYSEAASKRYGEPYVNQPYYSPYLDAKALCISAPLVSKSGVEPLGVIVNYYDLAALSEITTNRTGLGETGEVYIVDGDGTMLTESRFIGGAPLRQRVYTEPVSKIAEGGAGMAGVYSDYRGVPVVGISTYLPEYGWTLLTEVDKSEAFTPIKTLGIVALVVGLVAAAAAAGVGIIFATSVSRPIRKLTDATRRFAGGDLGARTEVTRRDEIGDLAKSFNAMAQELEVEITERERREVELRKLSLVVEQSPATIVITDKEGSIEYVNHKFTELTGYSPEEVIGGNPRILKSGKTPSEEYKRLWETITSGGIWRGELCNKKKNGELYWESVSISPIKDSKNIITHFIAIKEDITERKQAEERIRQLAYYDPLTGLPNRVLYNDRLSLALAHAQRTGETLAVLFLDLDRFKDINDTLGHSIGDQLLKAVAERLTDSLRKEDTATRQGGDEFTLLLPGMTQAEDAARVAQKILEAVRKPLTLGGHELNITTSIGVALYPADGEDGETLLKNVDTAMYHAKELGRNNYQFFTPALHVKTVEQLEMESSMHHALERKEFVVYYQPQVDIKTGRIVSSEALVRWQRPGQGLVNPSEFISMAERTGLIVPIGEWVLRAACAENKALQDTGLPPLQVAVNLSARQFQQENLVEMVEQVLEETGLDARFLVLEVTESTAMHNVENTAYKMERLNAFGVHFVIDDLGTGYSSLSYLKTFPIHALKIDRSFVQDVASDSNDAAIVTAVISMAKGLGLKVVAEGVETVAQLEFLRSLGCDEAQGYLFSKPMPAEEFRKILEQDKHLRA
jgi:diguanylate cyclase (GGDEF)-like protein/PAS domain S-box-containing protein